MSGESFEAAPVERQLEYLGVLAKKALPHWGLDDADLQLLKHRENTVFRVSAPDGQRFAMRVHRVGYHSDRELLSELQWLESLRGAGVATTVARHARDGALFVRVSTAEVPDGRQCDLLEWVPGKPIGSIEEGVALEEPDLTTVYALAGEQAALIHNHGVCNKTFIELAGVENAEGAIFPCGKMLVAEGLPDADPQKQVLLDFIADYEAFSGNPRSTFAGHAWDAFQLVCLALESLPDGLSLKEQRAAVRDYIENETAGFVGTGGTFQISAKDHNGLGPDSMTLLRVVDGEWTYFGPDAW